MEIIDLAAARQRKLERAATATPETRQADALRRSLHQTVSKAEIAVSLYKAVQDSESPLDAIDQFCQTEFGFDWATLMFGLETMLGEENLNGSRD